MTDGTQQTYTRYKKYTTDLRRYYRLPAVQTSLSVVLSLFVVAFFILVAIRPTLITIAKLNKTIEDSQKTLDQLTKKAAALNQISKLWEEISPLQPYIENTVPSDSPRYQSIAKAVELVAVESNILLTGMTLGEALTYSEVIDPYSGLKREVVTMPFTLRASGGYPEIASFFGKLTQIDRLVTLDSIVFSKDAKSRDARDSVSLSITGQIAYLADDTLLNSVLGTAKGSE